MKKLWLKIKQWFKSKTVWFGTVGVPVVLQFLLWAQTNIGLIRENLGVSYGVISFIIGFSVFWLRLVTTKPITEK